MEAVKKFNPFEGDVFDLLKELWRNRKTFILIVFLCLGVVTGAWFFLKSSSSRVWRAEISYRTSESTLSASPFIAKLMTDLFNLEEFRTSIEDQAWGIKGVEEIRVVSATLDKDVLTLSLRAKGSEVSKNLVPIYGAVNGFAMNRVQTDFKHQAVELSNKQSNNLRQLSELKMSAVRLYNQSTRSTPEEREGILRDLLTENGKQRFSEVMGLLLADVSNDSIEKINLLKSTSQLVEIMENTEAKQLALADFLQIKSVTQLKEIDENIYSKITLDEDQDPFSLKKLVFTLLATFGLASFIAMGFILSKTLFLLHQDKIKQIFQ